MIIRGIVIAVLAGASLYSTGVLPDVFPKEKEQVIQNTVKKLMKDIHFDPKEINDEFSEQMFNNYVKSLDASKRFLTQEDIDELSRYKFKLDDQVNGDKLDFFDLSVEKLQEGIEKTRIFYKEILDKPFDFSSHENLEMDSDKRNYQADDAALKVYWTKLLKYEVLTRLENAIEENEKSEEKKTLAQLEAEKREKVLEVYNDWFKRLDKLRRSDRFELYLSAFTNVFDPHSDYFSPKDKADFDIRMNNKLEGIGARLQADGDYTKIVSIIPGGPAWKGKELEVNDLIVQVAQEDGEYVDITGMRLDDVVQLIRGKKDTKVRLQVKKKDGNLEEIVIIRDEVKIEDGKAKSVIIGHNDIIDNIGFIRLPSFYLDFNDKNGSSSADDLAKEIDKLKDQGVKGIVIDLRFNGGGSLTEVIEMAGFFIEEGPIVQVKPRGKAEPHVYLDKDGGDVKYDGPLVVLVNSFSVSASEILAAALQDYKRAVIVGSKSTFGKGTVQRFWDLDRVIRGGDDIKPLGEVKITTQKFYRINGGSTQLTGVISDVVLPDSYHYMETGEKELDNAMQWSKIQKREYNQNTYKIDKLPEIARRSNRRLQLDNEFRMVKEQATVLKKFRDNSMVPLNLQEYQMMKQHRDEVESSFDELYDKEIAGMSVVNLPQDMEFINIDSSRMAQNEEWLKALQKDFYTEEVLHVMKDLIELH